MKSVKAEIASSKPISLSKASFILSQFIASDTGAQPDVSAYLRRAAAAFEDLVTVHREIRHHRKKKLNERGCEAGEIESNKKVGKNERKEELSKDEMKKRKHSDGEGKKEKKMKAR